MQDYPTMRSTDGTRSDEVSLHRCLQNIVRDRFHMEPESMLIERKRSEYSSWYQSDVVSVRLNDGILRKVFLKTSGVRKQDWNSLLVAVDFQITRHGDERCLPLNSRQ